jgi:AraC-like DNA-binding protein
LVLVSLLIAYGCVSRTFLHVALLPGDNSFFNWQGQTETDLYQGGKSQVELNDVHYSLDFELTRSDVAEHPAAAVSLLFQDAQAQPELVDLSAFTSLSFSVKCSTANVLTMSVFAMDEQISKPQDFLTYRAPAAYFSCDDNWSQVELDLTRLETPQWWLDMFHLKLSMNDYRLDQVAKLQFASTFQSPRNLSSRVQINQLMLNGRDWRYMYFLAACLLLLWAGYGIWFFRQHTTALIGDLKSKIQRDRPLVAYQQLSVEPQRDKDQDAILRYMATSYANPELNLDTTVSAIGVSRTKINDILKAELGFTFTGYLNKLRLTEAARLLAAVEEANIAEIAYSVGYKNVSYFNKLFKEEYGCTPKTFKQLYDKTADAVDR